LKYFRASSMLAPALIFLVWLFKANLRGIKDMESNENKTLPIVLNEQSDLFKQRQRKEYEKNKDKFVELPVTDVHLEPSKKVDDIHVDQYEPKPEKYKTICMVIFILLFFVGPGILLACIIETGIPGVLGGLMIIIYIILVVRFRFWTHEKGYMKFPTKEEREAEKEASMRKWGGPIKSAHIIRLERGLYTGLGNRRPYPHGRRTKNIK
jgi:hypothetical protein